MIQIRYVEMTDQSFWCQLDSHISKTEFENKVRIKRGIILFLNAKPIGLLRYNLFWDQIPFCTMLFIDKNQRGKGYGKQLLTFWEEDMKKQGYEIVLTSTQVDETAQTFYRKLGYQDCGGLIMNDSSYAQPMEIFLRKKLDEI